MSGWTVEPLKAPLSGDTTVPGDKSVTHRAYILGAMAHGRTEVIGPLRAEDTDNTLKAVRALGVRVGDGGGRVVIDGTGVGGFAEPADVLDLGNSGTGARLMAGLLSGSPFLSVLTGDASLRQRPMRRVVEPLRMMGARIDGRGDGSLLPMAIRGGSLRAIRYRSPVASAQVKSCVILAALQAEGTTEYGEPSRSRDHTERMLLSMGAELAERDGTLLIGGGLRLAGAKLIVPGDISSAAFIMAAAAIIPGSEVTVRGVGVNPTRTGILELLRAMGADVAVNVTGGGPEPVADVVVRGGAPLKGVPVPPEWIPSIIDELPVAAVAAAACEGRTEIRGAAELRVKESDRITATVRMLRRAGVIVDELEDGFVVHGPARLKGAEFVSGGDHRIAMSSAVLALAADGPSRVRDTDCVATSFPEFRALVNGLATETAVREDA